MWNFDHLVKVRLVGFHEVIGFLLLGKKLQFYWETNLKELNEVIGLCFNFIHEWYRGFYSCPNDTLDPDHRFGHLACFPSDVGMFLEVLAPDKKTELLENLKKITPSTSIITTKALGQSMTLFKLQVLSGNMFHLSVSGASFDFIPLILVISVWCIYMIRPTSYALGVTLTM